MAILTQNGKMRKSQVEGIELYNFGIPALISSTGLVTCPNATICASGCYARSGTYNFPNVKNAYEQRLELTKSPNFINSMLLELNYLESKTKAKGNKLMIRVHDSGDFYSDDYLSLWLQIMAVTPNIQYYAYTKMISMVKNAILPPNFTPIFSLGGKEDSYISLQHDRHSKVFESVTQLDSEGYSDASNNDLVAIGPSCKIGLVYHGQKNYVNTRWPNSN